MINKAINRAQKKLILVLSIVGAVIGLSLLMVITQVYSDLELVKSGDSGAINDQYLVIKKEVGIANTLGIGNSEFSIEELAKIESQPFVKKLATFTSARNFEVFAKIKLETGQDGSSLGYFESIPNEFIDADSADWSWKEGEDVKVIMPTTMMDMYNFGLAETMNTPKLSKGTVGLIPIEVRINGNGTEGKYVAHISDFSDRVNSVLVPIDFLNYLNNKYGTGKEQAPTKIIIATANNKDPRILQYLEANGLEANKEQIRGSIIEKLIQPILTFVGILCLLIILLTMIIFLLYGEILIIKSKFDIHVLSLLGHRWKDISAVFNIFFIKIYTVITVISLLIYSISHWWISSLIEEKLVYQAGLPFISWLTIFALLLFLSVFILINILSTRKHIKKIASP